MGKPTRWQAMLQHSCGRVPKGKVNVITRKTEVVKPFSKSFGQVPRCKAEDDTVGPPAKRRMAELCINHSAVKSLPTLFGRVPKCKAEGDAARLPPKRRVVKSSGITHMPIHFGNYPKYPNYCRVFLVIVIWLQWASSYQSQKAYNIQDALNFIPVQWAAFLCKVDLHHLTELEVDQTCPPHALTTFLIAHEAVSKLTISHCGIPAPSRQHSTHRSVLHSL
ncbi:hypothetical protein EDD16DRAFT_1523964 [Pisolithus croceorrhizus]|nr:hypothetical protein EV401DRAFT_1895332 [Pisolithus croceorrhizus]KAI6106405.1 hypothetical protein EDD16DRAFT_1523964 [Pisolithus croceorrhizus]KAI6165327.1 hypothetical protein EDD17DRAFT_1506141 [Pisolithus thermaeus]